MREIFYFTCDSHVQSHALCSAIIASGNHDDPEEFADAMSMVTNTDLSHRQRHLQPHPA